MRVVVVGAGLAGLRVAERLRAAGCEVVVLESSRRIGGRVRTVHSPLRSGQHVETGAEWVDDHHERMHGLIDRFGLRVEGAGEQWSRVRRLVHLDGRLLTGDELTRVSPSVLDEIAAYEGHIEAVTAGLLDPSRPNDHPEAPSVDRRSLADVAAAVGLGRIAALLTRRDAQGEFAAEPAEVSLLFVAQQRAYQRRAAAGAQIRAHRVEGGLSQLADAMADELGPCIRRAEEVHAVEQRGADVVVRTRAGSLVADHVVLACALPAVRRLRLRPLPPPDLWAAITGLGYGTVTKTALQWPGRSWANGYLTTDRRVQRVYEPTVDGAGSPAILMAYCGGEGGHRWAQLTERARLELAAAEMQVIHGFDTAPLAGVSRAWSTHRRYGGSYAVYRPGEVGAFWDVLRAPWGRVHLAGEHVATCTGYMEGALESGDTVSRRILEAQ